MSKKHAEYGSPSSMPRLKKCRGSVAFGKQFPARESTVFSIEGDVFHDYMERCGGMFIQGTALAPWFGPELKEEIEDAISTAPAEYEDMQENIWDAGVRLLTLWHSFQQKHKLCKIYFELKIKVNADIFGTSDVVMTGVNKKTGKIDVLTIDWKYGRGVQVKSEENLQGITYLIGAIRTLKLHNIGTCMVIIAQVRTDDNWEQNRYTFTGADVERLEKEIIDIVNEVKAIDQGKAPMQLAAGAHCKFCRAEGNCPAQKQEVTELVKMEATELPLEDVVRRLTLDEQVELFKKKSFIEDFLSAVAANLQSALLAGVKHPAVKVVETKGRRGWDKDLAEEKLVKELKKAGIKDPYTKKVIGITEAGKLAKKEIDHLIKLGAGKQEVVLAGDKRPEISVIEAQELPE